MVKEQRAIKLAHPEQKRDLTLKLYRNMIKYYAGEAVKIEEKREGERLHDELSQLAERLKANEATLRSELEQGAQAC